MNLLAFASLPPSTDDAVHGAALGASLICLVPAVLIAVLPGWVIARI